MTRGAPTPPEITAALRELVRRRYDRSDGWETFEELRIRDYETGGSAERYLDAAAFRTWASRLERVAIEIKATRSDWLRELDAPEKRRPAERYFHRRVFVVAHGVAHLEEVPDGWGLMVGTKNLRRIVRKRAARRHDAKPFPWAEVATILRHCGDRVAKAELPSYLRPSADAVAGLRAARESGDVEALTRAADAAIATAEAPDAIQAEVDRQVNEAFSAQTRLLEQRIAQVRRAQEEAQESQRALVHLARLAGGGLHGDWRERSVRAVPEDVADDRQLVELLVSAAVRRRLAEILGHIRCAHDSLGQLLEAAEGDSC